MTDTYARVYLLDAPFCIDRTYDYKIPTELINEVKTGSFVLIPFGNSNRKKLALVFEITDKPQVDKTKSIIDTVSEDISLSDNMLGLALYIKDQTLCTIGEAIQTMIPSSVLSKLVEYYHVIESKNDSELEKFEERKNKLDEFSLSILYYIEKSGKVSSQSIKSKFGMKSCETIKSLLNSKIIEKELILKDSEEKRIETVYTISPNFFPFIKEIVNGEKILGVKLTSQKHKDILLALCDEIGNLSSSHMTSKEIMKAIGEQKSISPQLKALCEKGIIVKSFRKQCFDCNDISNNTHKEIELNKMQNEAYETLKSMADSNEPRAALLFGVTGSGKTSVILKTIDHVISIGKSAIVLLPEIALTPQSIAIFSSHYGESVAVMHSRLSQGERSEAYLKIRRGDAKVVLGTRSAIFAPVKNLGLIVIDEEQEHTYKSDKNPKYHTRDIARKRCADENALMLLASATPSIESYAKALSGKYTLIKLTQRYGDAKLPDVIVADMRNESQAGNTTPIGSILTSKLIENERNGGQSILFINRRGYNNLVSCRSCGSAITCPNCSVAMTYHTKKGSYEDGELVCHWCGKRMKIPKVCPNCSSEHLTRMGYGTQRIQQELETIMSGTNAKILRMDTDSTTGKYSYDKMLSAFRNHEASILLGTQMVTKGHDFPDVTLVGVLLADSSLYLDDYRASEKTFDLITQVIGRAGRSKRNGIAVIQTNNPDSEVIKLACNQDYETFAKRELRLRKLLVFPPFCDIVLITLQGSYEKELMICTNQLFKMYKNLTAKEFSDVATITFGPFEAPVYKVDNKFRMRMVIKCRLNKRARSLFKTMLLNFSTLGNSKVQMSIDFNPSSL